MLSWVSACCLQRSFLRRTQSWKPNRMQPRRNRHRPPWRAGAVLIVARQTARLQCTRPRRGASCGRPARPVLRSSVQVPCNHSCEAIAPVRLISVHRRRNLNGDSLMHTVDRGREWPYFDVSHCSTLQSGGSAVRPDAASGRTQRLRVTGGFRVPPKRRRSNPFSCSDYLHERH
jgi:hypothetical protein